MRALLAALILSLPLTAVAEEERTRTVIAREDSIHTVRTSQLIRAHMDEHMDLDGHGLRYRWKVESTKHGEPPLKFEVEGPVFSKRNPFGLLFTVRF